MSCWTKEQLENMLEEVVNELELSEGMIEKHAALGTPTAELVRLVLEQKDKQIRMLKCGMVEKICGDHDPKETSQDDEDIMVSTK